MLMKSTLAAGVVALGALFGTAPASADSFSFDVRIGQPGYVGYYDRGYGHGRYTLSPREVRRVLRARGFREIRYVDRRGSIYQARAENRRGRDVLVTVSARNGEILDVQRIRGRGRG